MKKTSLIILLGIVILSSCAKDITPEPIAQQAKTEAFSKGESPNGSSGQFYFIKRLVQYPDARPTEVLRKYGELNMPHLKTRDWEAVHPAFSAAITGWLADEKTKQDPSILVGIEMSSYVFLKNYLFQAKANDKLADAAAFYTKTLMELDESSEWGILAKALTLSRDALTKEEYQRYAAHIRTHAEKILKNGPEQSYPEQSRINLLNAAQEAAALLGGDLD